MADHPVAVSAVGSPAAVVYPGKGFTCLASEHGACSLSLTIESGSIFCGEIILPSPTIDGWFGMRGDAFSLPGLLIDGLLKLPVVFRGEIDLPAPEVQGRFGLTGEIELPGFDIDGAFTSEWHNGFAMDLPGLQVDGLLLSQVALQCPAPIPLPGLIIDGQLSLRSVFYGDIEIEGPQIRGELIIGSLFRGDVLLGELEIDGRFLPQVMTLQGDVSLPGLEIEGTLRSLADRFHGLVLRYEDNEG